MSKTGRVVCSVLLTVGGLLQFTAMMTGSMLLGFVMVGSLIMGLAMLAAAYGVWALKNWGRILGIILGSLEILLGGIMGGVALIADGVFTADIPLAISGAIIVYLLLMHRNTRALYRNEAG